MSVQLVLVFAAVAAAALYFGRGFVLGLLGQGCGTEQGCTKCSSGGACTLTRLATIQKDFATKKGNQIEG